jgi:hypothetical protein
VADLSPGLATPMVTYGPGQRVTGIVIHHPAPEEVIFEVHVILSEAHCIMGSADADADVKDDDAPADNASAVVERDVSGPSPITEIAGRIRGVVGDTVRSVAPLARVRVDVFIDDLR